MRLLEFAAPVKARIEHPEDRIFDGADAAIAAVKALQSAAQNPSAVSVKWDGAPAIIFGWFNGKFVMTDKTGYNKASRTNGSEGFYYSGQEAYKDIFNKKPEQEGRKEYSTQFGSLFPYLQALVPNNTKGFFQADVMWFATPQIKNNNYTFAPNKVTYSIPSNSELGKQVSHSKVGIVIHSLFKTLGDSEPVALIPNQQKFNTVKGLVVLNPSLSSAQNINVPATVYTKLEKFIAANKANIDKFLSAQPKMGTTMKSYAAWESRQGNAAEAARRVKDFPGYIDAISKLSNAQKASLKQFYASNAKTAHAIWRIVEGITKLKMLIKNSLDKQTGNYVAATLGGKPGHEGFVAATPSGKIKLVNRPLFMKIASPLENT